MHFHWQDLKKDFGGERDWLHGRAWWHFGRGIARTPTVQLSWRLGRTDNHAALTVSTGGEDDLRLGFVFFWFSLYLTFTRFLRYGALQRDWPRQHGVSWFGDALMLAWNYNGTGYIPSGQKEGWHWYWVPLDTILGPRKYSSRDLPMQRTRYWVDLPEKRYIATVKMTEATWKRPRWPWPLKVTRADVKVEHGIPMPGRGENGWDCGEDRTYSLMAPASTPEEGVQKLIDDILETRLERGGPDWRPEANRPKPVTPPGAPTPLTPRQRAAKKRLERGQRTFRPVVVDGKYEIHPGGDVYERVVPLPGFKERLTKTITVGGEPERAPRHHLVRVTDPELVRKVREAAAQKTSEGPKPPLPGSL